MQGHVLPEPSNLECKAAMAVTRSGHVASGFCSALLARLAVPRTVTHPPSISAASPLSGARVGPSHPPDVRRNNKVLFATPQTCTGSLLHAAGDRVSTPIGSAAAPPLPCVPTAKWPLSALVLSLHDHETGRFDAPGGRRGRRLPFVRRTLARQGSR